MNHTNFKFVFVSIYSAAQSNFIDRTYFECEANFTNVNLDRSNKYLEFLNFLQYENILIFSNKANILLLPSIIFKI